jgi:UDP-glucuronate 4-epimerase
MPLGRVRPLWGVITICLCLYLYILPTPPVLVELPASHCCRQSNISSARVLITGAAGFIGMHLALALHKSHNATVVGLDILNGYYSRDLKAARLKILQEHRIPVVVGDVCDPISLKALFQRHRFTHVAHLAAYAGVRYSEVSPQSYERSNVRCLIVLLEVLSHLDYRPRIVMASSSSVYGNAPVPFREPKTGVARSIYAATKQATESLSFIYHQQFGLDVTMLRFFTVYGPYGRPDMAIFSFTHKLLTGQPITLRGGGGMLRDFTYVDDIVSGVVGALRAQCGGGYHVYNLGNNHPVNASAILVALEKLLGRKAVVRRTKQPLTEVDATWADVNAARQHLCWQPRVRLEEGLRRFTDWYIATDPHHVFAPHVMSQPAGLPSVLLTSLLHPEPADGSGKPQPELLVAGFRRWLEYALKVIDTRTTSVVVFHALPAATVAEQARLLAPVVQFFYVSPQYFAKVQGLSVADHLLFLWLDFLEAHPEARWVVIARPDALLLRNPFPLLKQGGPVLVAPPALVAHGLARVTHMLDCLPPAVGDRWNIRRALVKGAVSPSRWSSRVLAGHRGTVLPLLVTITDTLLLLPPVPCDPIEGTCRNCSDLMLAALLDTYLDDEAVTGAPIFCPVPSPNCTIVLP